MKKRMMALLLAGIMVFCLAACETNAEPQRIGTDLFADDDIQTVDPATVVAEDGTITYNLTTKRYSHWWLDENGKYNYLSDTKIQTGDDWYGRDVQLSSKDTAYIVMDPWIDWCDDFVSDYFGKITEKTTLPLMQALAETGHTIIILTNDPEKMKYNTKITPGLQDLVDEGKAMLLYHQDYSYDKFNELLDEKGITKLVYTGYASNMCILYRELGIANMVSSGKQLFFVPDCSGAKEHKDTWETQEIHHATTFVIGQTQALLLEFEDIMNAIKPEK